MCNEGGVAGSRGGELLLLVLRDLADRQWKGVYKE